MSKKYVHQVSAAWQVKIDEYLGWQRVAGHPPTTVDTRRQHLNFLARRIGSDPHEVTTPMLMVWLGQQDWAPESRRSRTGTYKLFWRWAQTAGYFDDITASIPRVRSMPGVPRPAPDRVYMKSLMRSDVRTRLILRLAAECGLRRGEIAVIHTDDLVADLVGWSLIVHGKGGKSRVVPLTSGIAHDLCAMTGWAFPGQINGHLSPRRVGELATDALDGAWTLHTLRHRFATRTYQIDHDVFAVQELLGHSSAETTRRYVARDSSRLRALVERAAG